MLTLSRKSHMRGDTQLVKDQEIGVGYDFKSWNYNRHSQVVCHQNFLMKLLFGQIDFSMN